MNQAIAILDQDDGPWRRVRRWLIMAPHPDDFDAVAVTLRRLADWGAELFLEVLTTGASGVDDAFAATWQQKVAVREAEQQDACRLFGLPEDRLRFHRLAEDKEGHMREDLENETRVRSILDCVAPAGVVLPHGHDSNADHQRTHRIFTAGHADGRNQSLACLSAIPRRLPCDSMWSLRSTNPKRTGKRDYCVCTNPSSSEISPPVAADLMSESSG